MKHISSAVGAGKIRRASRIIQRDGRAFIVAIDQQSSTGEGPALDAAVKVAEGGADAILSTWQIARRHPEAFAKTGLILRIDGALTQMGSYASGDVFSVMYMAEEAATIGADAVLLFAFPGAGDEELSLRRVSAVVSECEKIGMPVFVESIPGGWGKAIPWDAEHIAKCARVCVELGADGIKTMAPPDLADMPAVAANVEAPIFVLGGPKKDTEEEAIQYAADVVAAGAAGIAFGRNTWGAQDPTDMAKRLHAAVHGA